MKNLRTLLACICLTFCSFAAVAQNDHAPLNEPDQNRPQLFASLPDRIPVSIDYINSLFGSPEGREVSFATNTLANNTNIEGKVISSGSKYNNTLQSVVIKSTNFNGATITVSKYVDPEGNVIYSGRVLSFQHADAYELKNESGNLVLVKRKFYSLVNE